MLRHLLIARALLCVTVAVAGFAAADGSAGARPLAAHAGAGAPRGTWKRVLTQADIDRTASFRVEPAGSTPPPPGPMTLAITKDAFTFTDDSGFSIGQTLRAGSDGAFDVLAYVAPDKGAFCTADEPQNASYTWKLDGGALVLTAVDDRCADRNSILQGRWALASKTRTLVARETRSKESKTGFSWTDRLSEGGKAVGTDSGSCKFVNGTRRATCQATFRLTDGTFGMRGTRGPSGVFRLTIAGGTGAYQGAKGSGTAKPAGKSKSLITLRFA
jgi:hypothetical protein